MSSFEQGQAQMLLGEDVYINNSAGIHLEKSGMVFDGGKLIANRDGVYGFVSFGDES